eukprot:TRINITY_DN2802_c0_g1_i1.p1 TRINITY_DN2802_c0_g1~~TRINITY_DN2802_c0_g1_i1.p1  ORF type:complete len:523 (+),score=138.34 TRINITY_DN2802_c0_g1_i1:67-1635(+)
MPSRTNLNFAPGYLFEKRYEIQNRLGQGAFGDIYAARDIQTNEVTAIKFEIKCDRRSVLPVEARALKIMKGSPFVAKLIAYGQTPTLHYMVTSRLGLSLLQHRRRQPNGQFEYHKAVEYGVQMLDAIRSVHDRGLLHRDIKPSNFCFGMGDSARSLYIIDFGLVRRYRDANGHFPARKMAGFRGTSRYASVFSHQDQDLSRRDDLWSFFYTLIELCGRSLPWRRLTDRNEVGVLKEEYFDVKLVQGMPIGFKRFLEHLISLNFEDTPNYAFLRELLTTIILSYRRPVNSTQFGVIPQPQNVSDENTSESGDAEQAAFEKQMNPENRFANWAVLTPIGFGRGFDTSASVENRLVSGSNTLLSVSLDNRMPNKNSNAVVNNEEDELENNETNETNGNKKENEENEAANKIHLTLALAENDSIVPAKVLHNQPISRHNPSRVKQPHLLVKKGEQDYFQTNISKNNGKPINGMEKIGQKGIIEADEKNDRRNHSKEAVSVNGKKSTLAGILDDPDGYNEGQCCYIL